jgi:lysophospholipase L1-like esterase/type 1 glutamine amidotransferase
MLITSPRTLASLFTLALCALASAQPIKTLIITGHNNHNWQYTSRLHEQTLEATGRFDVDITDTPWTDLADAAKVKQYQLFVLDYNDFGAAKPWGEAGQANFAAAVRAGAGVASIHSANNSFKGWDDYEKMHVLLWRDKAGHGKFHEFEVNLVDRDHPIAKGLPASFTTRDELYHGLHHKLNTSFSLLAEARSSTESGGSGNVEPMALTTKFGEGRIFATPLGHVWTGADETKVSITTPGFKSLVARGAEWAATGNVTLPADWVDTRTHNVLTPEEKAEGWTLLFDGTSTDAWRSFNKPSFPDDGWKVEGGTLRRQKGQAGGDLITREQFGDFEFALDWLATPGANSGVIYRVAEGRRFPWETGMEMQILDDAGHPDGKKPKTRAGTLYDLYATSVDVARPAGVWNQARIVARGTRIQHYLNGFLVVDTDLAGEDYKAAHAASKWPGMKEFATQAKGHIALQEHGDEVWFRNIKVRRLDAPQAAPTHSANTPAAKDRAGWIDRVATLNERLDAPLQSKGPRPEIVFIGDSITEGWLHSGKSTWEQRYAPRHAINLGIGGDQTQHVLYRLKNGHIERLKALAAVDLAPRAFVVMIGTNNSNGKDNTAPEIADGIVAITRELRAALPGTPVLLLNIFPRGEKPNAQREKNAEASRLAAAALASDTMVSTLDLAQTFLEPDGTLTRPIMPDALHLSEQGYQRWADAMEPALQLLIK